MVILLRVLNTSLQSEEPADLQKELEAARTRIRELEAENRALRGESAPPTAPEPSGDPAIPATPASEPPHSLGDRLDQKSSDTKTFGKPRIRMEYQFDSRNVNNLNIDGTAPLPYGFNLWGFVDFYSAFDGGGRSRFEESDFFYEIDLKRKVWKDVGVILEVNDQQGVANTVGRAGVSYDPTWLILNEHDLFLTFKAFPVESNGHGYQLSVAWDKRFPDWLGGRFSTGGWFDANFDGGPGHDQINLLSEVQFRYRLVGGLHALTELKYNELLADDDEWGVGVGVQYRF
jgi:hypothetical protein